MGKDVEALENVIEDEPYFLTEIVDNDLRTLTMITKNFMSDHKDVKALENVIEDGPYFLTEIIDNDLRALTMITKNFMSEHEKDIIGSQWQKVWWQRGEDYLNGCDGASRREVNGREVDLGVFKSLLGEIPGDVMGKRGGDTIGVGGGTIW
ncbi:hypothetical protein Tco_0710361 [Tanacetum coccineum]